MMTLLGVKPNEDGTVSVIGKTPDEHFYELVGCKADYADLDFDNNRITLSFVDCLPVMGDKVAAIQAALAGGEHTVEWP